MTPSFTRFQRSPSAIRSPRGLNVEQLEPRRLFTNTLQVEISPTMVSINARDIQNLPIHCRFTDLAGMLTLTGENLSAQSGGHSETISGNVTAIDDISLSSSTSRSAFSVTKSGSLLMLDGFESPGAMNSINLTGTDLEGVAQLLAPPFLTLGNGDAATINITQVLPVFNLTGGNFTGSAINITGTAPSQAVNLRLGTVTDTQIVTSDLINSLNLKSITATTPGRGGITAGGGGSFNIAGDYTADLKLTPNLSLKYTLNDFNVGRTASGSWNIAGGTRSLYARTFDSGFNGTFGTLGTLRAGTNFGGSLTAGSVGDATVGNNLIGANWNLTDPFATNSWNLSSLHVGNEIQSSTIRSDGNLGDISTMFTYYSQIGAGLSPTYAFGQTPVTSSYASYSYIKSFVSDCPSHHNIHFVGSYVGAAYLSNIHLGNVATDNFGQPFGMAGIRMDKVSVLVNSKAINLQSLGSTADFDAGLQRCGMTEQSLGDFKFLFPM